MFQRDARPLLEKFCHACHAGERIEAELDLSTFQSVADVRRQSAVWKKVRDVLDSGDMPPPEGRPLVDASRKTLRDGIHAILVHEARANAGDPGPVGLRRLDNAEYTFAIRDLTGVDALDPAREFPVDGAAGEGFTNVAAGRGMSPALVQKYLDAAKETADHIVPLPDGLRFSASTSQRDHSDEAVARIQAFYRRYTADGGGEAVNLQGVQFETNQGGLLPLERYLTALLEQRDKLRAGGLAVEDLAARNGLSAKYLTSVWKALEAKPGSGGFEPHLDALRTRWQAAKSGDAAALAKEIDAAQKLLWAFRPVGQIGREGGSKRWMEGVSSLATSRESRHKFPAATDQPQKLSLTVAAPAGRAAQIVWRNPRLEFAAKEGRPTVPPVSLREVRAVTASVTQWMANELPKTEEYLRAAALLRDPEADLVAIASESKLDAGMLRNWGTLLEFGGAGGPITGHFTARVKSVGGYEAVNGWEIPGTPSVIANRSKQAVAITTLTVPPRAVAMHPSPTLDVMITWRSPVATTVRVSGLLADADDKCGNGAAWRVDLRTAEGAATAASGVMDNGGKVDWKVDRDIAVRAGDLITVAVGPRDANHACDTTHVEFVVAEVAGEKRSWNLAEQVVDRILEANPLPDLAGNKDVWHFRNAGVKLTAGPALPADSTLALWRAAVVGGRPTDEVAALAKRVAASVTMPASAALAAPDKQTRERLLDWRGPLDWLGVARGTLIEGPANTHGLEADRFSAANSGAANVGANDLVMASPGLATFTLPPELAAGAEFASSVELVVEPGDKGVFNGAQASVTTAASPRPEWVLDAPVLVAGEPGRHAWEPGLAAFRELFPPALCYSRIVPVDEVVTLLMYYREDDHLRRLMLSDAETAELERLWDELLFISEEPVKLVVALEQLIQFATQDRQDLVPTLQAIVPATKARAEAFLARKRESEPARVEAVCDLAARAWRRPLTDDERRSLREFHARLRADGTAADAALRLTAARVLGAPEFLFKLESAEEGTSSAPVNPRELATRLSFFLWSSVPDAELMAAADTGHLQDEKELRSQTHRLLRDAKTRRMAVRFACQWLHIRDFDKNNDKNESLFPEFAELRGPMYEETVLFFEDLFRNDGSVYDLLEADHTFVNERLAKHYGWAWPIPETHAAAKQTRVPVGGDGWRRVEGVRKLGRGGVLGMATVLASQSGASRTSPILRGNWVFETLLGERLPKPPPGVPQLPEAVPEGLTERAMIEQHSSVAACARCHRKIDPFGFALEGFDPLGRARAGDVHVKTTLADGRPVEGLAGLRDYLATARRQTIVRTFCRKLLGYALGRETMLTDEPLLEEIERRLAAGEGRFSLAVEAIVTSRQFRELRRSEAR